MGRLGWPVAPADLQTTRVRPAMENAAKASAPAPAQDDDDDGPVPVYKSDRSTHFAFTHKVFTVNGALFHLSQTEEPLFRVELGDLKCGIAVPSLRNEFGIKADSEDGKLLALIEKALRFVKEIRPGDSIPKELLDGSCSWTIEDRHRKLAHNRMTVQLVSWLSGGEADVADATKLEQLAND